MKTANQASKTVIKIVAIILAVLVLAGIVGIIVRFTGGFTSDFTTFYVTVDGKDVMSSAGGFEATPQKPMKVDVKYVFGDLGGDVSGYSVKVVPHVVEGKDFDFTLNGQAYSFQAESNMTAGFEIEYEEHSFTLTPKGGVDDVLEAVYPNNEIGDCSDKGYEDMYALIVTSYNGKASVTLYFSVLQEVAGVTLDQEVIEF